jgi:type IV pilus assembly protein PilB
MARVLIGQLLQQQGLIEDHHIQSALTYQVKWGGRIGQALLRLRFVEEERLLATLGRQLGVPSIHIGDQMTSPGVLRLIPEKVIRRHRVLPLEVISTGRSERLVVAFPAPENLLVVDEVAFAAGMDVEPVLAGDEDLDLAIARHLDPALELPRVSGEPMCLVDGRRLDG